MLPPSSLKTCAHRQHCNPHKKTAFPCCSPYSRVHHTCTTQQRLHLTFKCRMACPGMATHTLAGLCALSLLIAASSSGNLHKPVKPQPPHTTCTALPQPPAQAPPRLLHPAEAALDLAVPHDMPRAGHSHIGRALCAAVAEYCLLLWTSPQTSKTATPPQTTCTALE